jgi:uncharacterized protein (DUF169 family)
MNHASQLQELLGLAAAPVGVSFRAEPPAGLERVPAGAPSGCSYWKAAAGGAAFYTEAADHYGCPVGAHTHGVDLPPEAAEELEGLVGTMIQLEYLRPGEVAGIPRRAEPFGVAVYAPVGEGEPPDVVLIRGSARQVMLLAEAANAAGAAGASQLMGRPTCAAIPVALQTGGTVTSLGCIGNRVYTGLGDDELYFALPGPRLAAVVAKLATILHANRELEAFHRGRAG